MSIARPAFPAPTLISEYCQRYQDVFRHVRSFDHFMFFHVGMLSEIKG